jgi:predicted nucleotidyltransferase
MREEEYNPAEKLDAKERETLILLAEECAKLLKEKYKVKKVFLIGSLVKGYFHERSDIDLVVEGLVPELYIKALTEFYDIIIPQCIFVQKMGGRSHLIE